MRQKLTLFLIIVFAVTSSLAAAGLTAGQAKDKTKKKTITSLEQLPRHTYPISGTITQMITDEKAFDHFAAQVRRDIEKVLAEYDLRDKATLRSYYGTLSTLDIMYGKFDSAKRYIQLGNAVIDKPGAKLTAGMLKKAVIQTRLAGDNKDPEAYKQRFAAVLEKLVLDMPWQTVQQNIIDIKGNLEFLSDKMALGLVQTQLEPAVKKAGYISSAIAGQLIRLRFLLTEASPLRDTTVKVLGKLITANRTVKADIWKDRLVDLSGEKNLSPVVVAIWDTGVDISLFPDHLWVNGSEKKDGKDTDGNGFIDDVHGIAYNFDTGKEVNLLFKPTEMTKPLSERLKLLKAYFDVKSSLDTPEARDMKKQFATMSQPQVKALMEDLMQVVMYMHGTHVAGIAVAGNPYVRLLTARQSFEYHQVPRPLTEAWAHKIAAMYKETVRYFQAHGVRVVNMSWDQSLREVEQGLTANGIGKDAAHRGQLARERFAILKKAFTEAIRNAPEILFVNSAGNTNIDPAFSDFIPTAIDLPNVMVAGAVDHAGDETTFTSFGKVVDVYANGFNVESYVPGGETMPGSGTSMSAPNVANLAAKLLAVNPKLKTVEVVDLIMKGATPSEDKRILLINPKKSMELLKKMEGRKVGG